MRSVKRFFTVNTLLLCVLSAPTEARIKCWEDADGATACGDLVPPGAIERRRRELDERGIERDRIERAPTAEEIERQQALDALRDETNKLRAEEEAYNSRLLASFPTLDDLLRARDGSIAVLDGQIDFARHEIGRLQDRRSKLQAVAAAAERLGKPPSAQQRAHIEDTDRSIADYEILILSKQDEKKATIEQYALDLRRYRELRQRMSPGSDADVPNKTDDRGRYDAAVRCEDGPECDRLWEKARAYALTHATTALDLTADRILATAPPRDVRDISITVARLADEDGGGERIFLDVKCANVVAGREFCGGPEVSAVRNAFRDALGKGSLD